MRSKENIKITTDRHLRFLAARDMGDIPKIRETLRYLHEKPEQLGSRGLTFDCALVRLSYLLAVSEHCQPEVNFRNLNELRAMGVDTRLFGNAISWLSYTYQRSSGSVLNTEEQGVYSMAESTFGMVADLINSGEWGYVRDITEPSIVISALIIEGWGLFLENVSGITGIRPIFVRAIEEVMGTEFSDTDLWHDVKPWVQEEASLFSSEFIRSIS